MAGKFTREVNKLARAKWQERPAYAKLSNEQKKFVDFYAGNIKEAAEKAGVSYDRAKKFMRQWTVQAALKERDEWEEALQAKAPKKRRVYTRLELQEFWTSVIMDQTEDMEIRLRAADALARSKAMFVNRVDVTSQGKSLAELIVESVQEARKNDPEQQYVEVIDVTPQALPE